MKASIFSFTAVLALILFSSNESGIKENIQSGKTIKIGSQEWMTENLDVDTYRNGDSIPQVKKPEDWAKLKTGAWCYYENKEENGAKYGKLYNWYAVNDKRGLAPEGFHVPSDAEWAQLSANLEEEEVGAKIKSRKGWKDNKYVTNETGFSALPGGYRYGIGPFIYEGVNACFWSSTPSKDGKAWGRTLTYNHVDMGRDDGSMGSGLSVRCIAD
jgi:uncharacterized protein (TIGR02145 family)